MTVPSLRSDARRNRTAIVDAAAACFAEQGLDAGVAEIARRAGVGPATLFRHFETKQDLVAAVLDLRTDQILTAVEEALDAAGEDPEAALVRFLEVGTELHLRDRGFLQAAVTESAAAEHMEQIREVFSEKIGLLLRLGQDAGVWREGLVAEDLGMMMSGAAGACMKFADAQPGIERRYLQLVLDGMRAKDAGPLPGPAPDLGAVIEARGSTTCGPRTP